MSDRTIGSGGDQPTGASSTSPSSEDGDAAAGRPQRTGQESGGERTVLITNPVDEPVHGRSGDRDPRGGDVEQEMPAGDSARRAPGGAPPWQRGGETADVGGIDVARPQHGTPPTSPATQQEAQSPPTGFGGGPSAPPSQFSSGSSRAAVDAPTGYFGPVEQPVAEEMPRDVADARDAAGARSAEQPMFEHAAPAAERSSARVRAGRPPRRASLQLKRYDPWSVLKLSLVLSVAGFLVWMVAVGVLYGVLEGMGVWDQLNGTYSDLTSLGQEGGGDLISAGRVFGAAAVIGAINVVLITAMATVGSLIYNVAADLVGGLELTLSERD